MKKQLILPAALALVLGATAACTSGYAQTPAPSDQTTVPAAPQQPGAAAQNAPHRNRAMQGRDDMHRRFDFTARAEARIAYVKADLKITPAQQAAFDRYAQVIRDNAAAMQKNFQAMRGQRDQHKNMSAIDRVEQRAKMAQERDQYEQQYLAAFKPLYASLSADQKKVADDLAAPHFGHDFRGHGRGGQQHDGPGPQR
ncbi:MAG TPA: Spy/CpxP family protein refolding chaperone [Stellaceae bacterium]|nr:Spy/CpxP family protein refolding chaperone [Stellaceae bacterium]